MIRFYVMFVDDEPDIREIIDLSLGLDSSFVVRGCSSGSEALAAAPEWRPDLILLDVMMPSMDGPATLGRLRDGAATAGIPVVFMTARAQARERAGYESIGAAGVIAKPFDPLRLASEVRRFVPFEVEPDGARKDFQRRIDADAAKLAQWRHAHPDGRLSPAELTEAREVAHALAGASGVHGLCGLSAKSAALEQAVMRDLSGDGAATDVGHALDEVLARIATH